jgi:uncharacterized damage-inducible protein DinB
MLAELEPVWKQFSETYAALRAAIAVVPDDRLAWQPSPEATPVARIAQHIARANETYANFMEGTPRRSDWTLEDAAARDLILRRLDDSEARVHTCLEGLTAEALYRTRADRWGPLSGPEVTGPLNSLWFAHQMVRHTAYHLGQINYIHLLLGL